MTGARSRAGRAARAVVLPLVVVVLAGCSAAGGSGSPSATSSTPQDPTAATRAEIERELTARDDVADAQVRYRDDLTVPGSAAVDVTGEPGADLEVLFDEAVRLVWHSDLDPLDSITVDVGDPDDPAGGISRIVDLLDDARRQQIESEFGPR